MYKRLFEVQLLHEYYLTNSDETTVFQDPGKKNIFLQNMFDADAPSVSDAILYTMPDAIQQLFKNYYLKLVAGYAGFAILTQVTEKTLPDGTTVYAPRAVLPAGASIIIQLLLKKPLLQAVTNSRISKTIPAIYYFTNQDSTSPKAFPVLSAPIAAFDAAYAYEQGELYAGGDGRICQYYVNGNNPDFLAVTGDGYASTADELLVGLQFNYRFNAADHVTSAKFELSDNTGKLVRTWSFTYSQPVKTQTIDARNSQRPSLDPPEDTIVSLPLSTVLTDNMYTLKVTINDTNVYMHRLIFFEDDQASPACWAVVDIKTNPGNPAFGLYEDDGYIKYRKKPDSTVLPPPVFELRVKSRVSFWRYINDRQAKLKLDSGSAFLQRSGTNNLASKIPRTVSALPKKYTVKNNSGAILQEKFLPNPASDERVMIEGGKIYADILVPVSDLFPLDTS